MLDNASISLDYLKTIIRRGAGFFPGEAERFAIDKIINKATRITREAAKTPIEVRVEINEIPEVKYYWLNLLITIIQVLENAYEALGTNGLIHITAHYRKTNNQVEILISNNANPIPMKVQSRIFEPGFSTKGEHRGMGLCLAQKCMATVKGSINLGSDEVKHFVTGAKLLTCKG